MDDTTISQVSPAAMGSPKGSGAKKIIIPLIIVLVLLGAIFGGAKYLQSRQDAIPTPTPFPTPQPTEIPTPTIEATPSASPTTAARVTPTKKPTPTPTKVASSSASSSTTSTKGLTVRVLNGSGVAGKASTAADFLKGLGYEITGTGNADNFDYEQTTISIKSTKSSLLPTLKSDLSTKYSVGTTSAALSSSETADAVVIIGKQ